MKRPLALLAVAVIAGSSGCSIIDRLFLANVDGPYSHHAHDCGGQCQGGRCQGGQCGGHCEGGQCGPCADGQCADNALTPRPGKYGGLAKHGMTAAEAAALEASGEGQIGPAGPPSGAVAYPYYTTRGPRDFLARRPPSIGPQ